MRKADEKEYTHIDPICGMEVDERDAAAESEYGGKVYYFCCEGCKEEFEANPGRFVNPSAR